MSDMDPNVVHYNARVRALKPLLYERAEIEEMLDQQDLGRMVDTMLDSPYRKEMAEALTRYEGADAIEEAVTRNLVATYAALYRRATEGTFRDLIGVFFQRWDLHAVKSLLRARHHGLDADTAAASLIPGPTLTVPLLHEFAQSDSMEALARQLAAWNRDLCACLVTALGDYEETGDLAALEDTLDRHYFVTQVRNLADASDTYSETLRDYLRAEIDRINLRTLFQALQRGVAADVDLDALMLPEGALPMRRLRAVAAAGDPANAVEQLSGTPYKAMVDELFQFLQTHRFSPIERFLDQQTMQKLRKVARIDVGGLAVVMDYIWRKYNEVINLRLVARGLSGHLPPGRVRDELFFV